MAGLAVLLSDAPWLVTIDDVEALRGAGLTAESILHVVVLSAFFNYLNRVADAAGIEFDYESPLPRMRKDPDRDPIPRPAPQDWPSAGRPPPLPMRLAERQRTAEAFAHWRAYLLENDEPISRRDRRVVARSAAAALCDARTVVALAGASPADAREQALADYAATLTAAPWRLTGASLAPLRAHGLDDLALLHVIAVASHQNTASRLSLILGDDSLGVLRAA